MIPPPEKFIFFTKATELEVSLDYFNRLNTLNYKRKYVHSSSISSPGPSVQCLTKVWPTQYFEISPLTAQSACKPIRLAVRIGFEHCCDHMHLQYAGVGAGCLVFHVGAGGFAADFNTDVLHAGNACAFDGSGRPDGAT